MPKCKICGEAVQSGEVMHVECREKWEAEIEENTLKLRKKLAEIARRERDIIKRQNNLDCREYELQFRERAVNEAIRVLEKTEKTNTWLRVMCITLSVLLIIISLSKILG